MSEDLFFFDQHDFAGGAGKEDGSVSCVFQLGGNGICHTEWAARHGLPMLALVLSVGCFCCCFITVTYLNLLDFF